MAAGADSLVERDGLARPKQLLQFGFIPRHRRTAVHLEYRQWEYPFEEQEQHVERLNGFRHLRYKPGILPLQHRLVSNYHL